MKKERLKRIRNIVGSITIALFLAGAFTFYYAFQVFRVLFYFMFPLALATIFLEVKVRENSKQMAVLALLLVFLSFSLPQETFGKEEYVNPVIETNCEQINATAYRFYSGNSLNFTYTFTNQEYVRVWFLKNFSYHVESETPYYTSSSFARIYFSTHSDGVDSESGYSLAGNGGSRGSVCLGYRAGQHTHKIIYIFRTFGDFDGTFELTFLTEPKFKIEKAEMPTIPTVPLVITGFSGATIAFAISAVIWHKKNSAKKEENNVES